MKVGILLPNSTTHPLIPHNFMGGINGAIELHGKHDFEIFTSSIGFGANAQLIVSAAEELLMIKQVDVLIAFADEPAVERLYPTMNALKKQLIVVNHGAKFNKRNNREYVAFHTLDTNLSAYLSGKWLKANHAHSAIVSSFYDGAYSITQNFVDGFATGEDSLGGIFILKHLIQEFDTSALKEYLKVNKNPFFCALSGNLVPEFFDQILDLHSDDQGGIIGSSVLIQETMDMAREIEFSIQGFLNWHPEIKTLENQSLMSSFQRVNSRPADAISALGWDTALILFALKSTALSGNAAFEGLELEAAKGRISFDLATGRFLSSQFFSSKAANQPYLFSEPIAPAEVLAAWKNITTAHPDGTEVGWVNTYLCS